jgi:hypothetical protein
MQTTSSVPAADRLNAVRHYVAYGPGHMPTVEVLSAMGGGPGAVWAAGEIRMHTVHEDGSRTFTVQFRHAGRLLVDNFPPERVRHDPPPDTADAAC